MTDEQLIAMVAALAQAAPRSAAYYSATTALGTALNAEPELSGSGILVRNVSGSHSLSSSLVAQSMLRTVHTGGTAAAAVAWLRKIPTLLDATAKGGAVKALYGVDCDHAVALSDDIRLLPFSQLGPSSTRDWLLTTHEAGLSAAGPAGFFLPPRAALYRAGTLGKVTISAVQEPSVSSDSWFQDLDVAASLLALVPRAIPVEAARWFYYDDPDIARLCEFGHVMQTTELLHPIRLMNPPKVAAESLSGMLPSYRAMKKTDQDRVLLGLQRLIRSRSQFNLGNRAVDLAIVLEVLFMNLDGGEHSHKISLRAARLVGATLDERRVVFDQVKRLYDMRSSMVHRGTASGPWRVNGNDMDAGDLVEAVDGVCVESIRRLMSGGNIPTGAEWRDRELGP